MSSGKKLRVTAPRSFRKGRIWQVSYLTTHVALLLDLCIPHNRSNCLILCFTTVHKLLWNNNNQGCKHKLRVLHLKEVAAFVWMQPLVWFLKNRNKGSLCRSPLKCCLCPTTKMAHFIMGFTIQGKPWDKCLSVASPSLVVGHFSFSFPQLNQHILTNLTM